MNDLFEEIQEDLREERTWKIIKRIFPYFVTISLIVIFSVTIYVYLDARKSESQSLIVDKYISLLQNNKEDKQLINALNDIYISSKENIAGIAGIKLADLYVKNNDFEKAFDLYNIISNSKNYDYSIISLAKLKALFTAINNNIKKEDFEKVRKEINIISKKDFIWYYETMELKALYLIKKGLIESAEEILEELLNDNSTPSTIKENSVKILKNIK